MQNCPHCGADVQGIKFCKTCGKEVSLLTKNLDLPTFSSAQTEKVAPPITPTQQQIFLSPVVTPGPSYNKRNRIQKPNGPLKRWLHRYKWRLIFIAIAESLIAGAALYIAILINQDILVLWTSFFALINVIVFAVISSLRDS